MLELRKHSFSFPKEQVLLAITYNDHNLTLHTLESLKGQPLTQQATDAQKIHVFHILPLCKEQITDAEKFTLLLNEHIPKWASSDTTSHILPIRIIGNCRYL